MLDLDLADIQPDFFSGSAHKWPCGPKEVGVLYVNARMQARVHPSIIRSIRAQSASRAPWSHGTAGRTRDHRLRRGAHLSDQHRPQSDRVALAWARPGPDSRAPPDRGRAALDASRSLPIRRRRQLPTGNLGRCQLAAALYRNDRIGCATRGGMDRPGIRFSPHIYNTMAEVDRRSPRSPIHASGRVARRSTRRTSHRRTSVTGLSLSNEAIGGAIGRHATTVPDTYCRSWRRICCGTRR